MSKIVAQVPKATSHDDGPEKGPRIQK